MNRHERRRREALHRNSARRQEVKDWHNRFVHEYVRHLPEVDPEQAMRPGLTYMACYHDDNCSIYDHPEAGLEHCNCNPLIKYHAEPPRN